MWQQPLTLVRYSSYLNVIIQDINLILLENKLDTQDIHDEFDVRRIESTDVPDQLGCIQSGRLISARC